MLNIVQRLWSEDAGFVVSSELVLVATIMVIGLLAGLATVRDQVVQELGDTAIAISQMNQSYSWSGITAHHASVAGSSFDDASDSCDGAGEDGGNDTAGQPPVCISLCAGTVSGETNQ